MLLQHFSLLNQFKIFLLITIVNFFTACDGGLDVQGNIFLSEINNPCDSCSIYLFDPDQKIIDSTFSSYGDFSFDEIVAPFSANYLLVSAKRGYANDTIKIEGPDTNKKITVRLRKK